METPSYPFYTLVRGGYDNSRIDSVYAYLGPNTLIEVDLFDASLSIRTEYSRFSPHRPVKWEATDQYPWKEELTTKKFFLEQYKGVQDKMKGVLAGKIKPY